MGQASVVQATIKGDVSGQVTIGSNIFQLGNLNGGILDIAPPSNQSACWNVSYHETRFR